MASFSNMDAQISHLRQQVQAAEAQLHDLKDQLEHAERVREVERIHGAGFAQPWFDEALSAVGWEKPANSDRHQNGFHTATSRWPLEQEEYRRYGRQLIMPQVGLQGQLALKNAKVLVVGVGGLGCPAAAYLAGAGVGTLGLVDGDTVEVSNLHRQIAHSTTRVGMSKVQSACEYLRALNPLVHYTQHTSHLTPESAIPLFEQYDLVLDCTDHPTSRYLISDACVLTGKPLVSASALKTEGQLLVLNNPPRAPGDTSGGPCYRCVWPTPPPAESVLSCGEGGILGPVVGVMGILQALEALKIIKAKRPPLQVDVEISNGDNTEQVPKPTMLLFSAYPNPQFRSVKLRPRKKDCAVCSSSSTITPESLISGCLDYVAFCGATTTVNILPPESHITAAEYATLLNDGSHMLIDVRDSTQYGICSLDGSINIPWTGSAEAWLQKAAEKEGVLENDGKQRYVVCRLGNDSQLVTEALMERNGEMKVRDVKGGFRAWRAEVDDEWPDY